MSVTINEAIKLIDYYKNLKKDKCNFIGNTIDGKILYIDMNKFSPQDYVKKYVVYLFLIGDQVYVGKTNNIVRRMHEHFTRRDANIYKHTQEENCYYITICDIFDTDKQAKDYENSLINALKYIINDKLINK